jgi:hypothetical protein
MIKFLLLKLVLNKLNFSITISLFSVPFHSLDHVAHAMNCVIAIFMHLHFLMLLFIFYYLSCSHVAAVMGSRQA